MRVLIFHNRSAGGAGDETPEDLARVFAEAGHAPSVHLKSAGPIEADMLRGVELVAIVGGDGTVMKALLQAGLREAPDAGAAGAPLFTIVPTGTANNIARTLGISGTVRQIAPALARAAVRPFDVGRIAGLDGHAAFFEAVGIGLVAECLALNKGMKLSGEEKMRAGRRTLIERLADARPAGIRASVDGEALPDDLILLEILNTPLSGPGLRLAGAARPDDGRLCAAFLRPGESEALAQALARGPDAPLPLRTVHGRRVELAWDGQALRVDNQLAARPDGPRALSITVSDRPLRFLVPPPAGNDPGPRPSKEGT